MSFTQRLRAVHPRLIGAGVAGVLAVTLAGIAGPAVASSRAPQMQMMASTSVLSTHKAHVGTTPGWFAGKTVTFKYTKNFVCMKPPSSHASSGCEGGSAYDSIPSSSFDPLYVVVPIGFTPAKKTLNCPTAGRCVDHPSTIDLSAVFSSAKYDNVKLPAHSHIITTVNGRMAEWWNVIVIGVTSEKAWGKIVASKSYSEITRLRDQGSKDVTNNIPTNLFLFFRAS